MKKIILLLSIGLISAVSLAAPAKKKTVETKTTTTTTTTAQSPASSSAAPSTTLNAPAHTSRQFAFEENKSELFLSATQAEINSRSGASNINISGLYTYLIRDQIQIGAQVSLGSSSYGNGGSYSTTDIYALGMYNFQPTINEAFFAFAGVGVASAQMSYGKSSESKAGFKFGAGKRFPLWAKIQYVPTASIEKVGEFDPMIRIIPVNFSLIF
jgi:hypothetical protein